MTFSGRVLLRLLDEAKGIPIIFAAVMPTGKIEFFFMLVMVMLNKMKILHNFNLILSFWYTSFFIIYHDSY